jgi:hypothetical protein
MKKAKLKITSLRKETISNLDVSKVKGGVSLRDTCPVETAPPGACHSFGQECDQTIGLACNSLVLWCA